MTLTADEIRQMEAGREMDAAVAGVLGWTNVKVVHRGTHAETAYGTPPDCDALRTEVPFCSIDIAAAWTVVEALHERGLYVSISKPPDMRTWDVRGWNAETNGDRFIAHAETAPLAICRAALLTTTTEGGP